MLIQQGTMLPKPGFGAESWAILGCPRRENWNFFYIFIKCLWKLLQFNKTQNKKCFKNISLSANFSPGIPSLSIHTSLADNATPRQSVAREPKNIVKRKTFTRPARRGQYADCWNVLLLPSGVCCRCRHPNSGNFNGWEVFFVYETKNITVKRSSKKCNEIYA